MKRIFVYCNQCPFVGDEEDFDEHIKKTQHTGNKVLKEVVG